MDQVARKQNKRYEEDFVRTESKYEKVPVTQHPLGVVQKISSVSGLKRVANASDFLAPKRFVQFENQE